MFRIKLCKFVFVAGLFSMVLLSGVAEAQEFVTEGLISFWTFDEATIEGEVIKDVWGNNDGTINGDVTTGAGKIGEAMELDGAGDYLSISEPQDIPAGDDTYAIEAWFYADIMKIGGIMGWGAWGTSNGVNALRLGTDVSGFRHYWWGNDLDQATGDISEAWHHVIAQHDGTTRSLWMDGEMINSDQAAGHNAQIVDVNIGVTNNRTEFWDGRLDEMRLYNRALEDDEIAQNYAATSNSMAIAPAGKLSAYWGEIKSNR